MYIEDRSQRVERAVLEACVGVEQQHVGRVARSDAEVAAEGEAAVASGADDGDVEVGDRVQRVVGRGVVDDDHADAGARRERGDAVAQRRAAAVADDHGVHEHC